MYICMLINISYLTFLFSQGLADNTVIAKVNNGVWDLDRPLEDDCSLQLLKFDDEEAQAVSPRLLWSDTIIRFTFFFLLI